MHLAKEEELKKIKGGGVSFWGVMGIVSFVVFLTGILDGVVHPNRCTET